MSARLTVVCPVYNGMPYLREAVESILKQSHSDFTFIIVNDGSIDGSADYLRSLGDPRIVLIDQANRGQSEARNAGLRHCKTEYVALMDQDDISMPGRLSAQIKYLDTHPDVVMVGTQIELLVGNTIRSALSIPTAHDEIETRLLKGRAGICHPSLMVRTAAAIRCGGYPVGVMGEDIDFCLRMCELGRAANLEVILFQYRMHAKQTSVARCRELVRANQYSAYSAICRRNGLPVPEFSAFVRDASVIKRCGWFVEAWELIQYRTGRIQMATGRPLKGLARLTLAGMCQPLTTVGRIAKMVTAQGRGRTSYAQAK